MSLDRRGRTVPTAAGRKNKIPGAGGTTLTISGVRRSEREGKEDGHRFSEVRYGRFERSLTVPAGLDPEKVTARYENGVLEVTAPLPPGFASRKVPIQIESHGSKKAA